MQFESLRTMQYRGSCSLYKFTNIRVQPALGMCLLSGSLSCSPSLALSHRDSVSLPLSLSLALCPSHNSLPLPLPLPCARCVGALVRSPAVRTKNGPVTAPPLFAALQRRCLTCRGKILAISPRSCRPSRVLRHGGRDLRQGINEEPPTKSPLSVLPRISPSF
jgi:hypothetical protein